MSNRLAALRRIFIAAIAASATVLAGLTFIAGPAAAGFVDARGSDPGHSWLAPTTRSGTLASEESAALQKLNERRAQLGLPALNRSPLIDTAARGHSNYLVCNNTTDHSQSSGRSCYTGATPGDRVRSAGYPWTSVYEVISAGPSGGAAGIEALIKAIYHRFALFATDVSDVGIGMMSGHPTYGTVLTANLATNRSPRPAMSASWIGVYPYDGQTDLPRDFDSDTESPDPVPDRNRVGYPVSLHVDGNLALSVSSFTLSKGSTALSGRLLAPGSSNTPKSVAAFIPLDALEYGTTYTARFVGSAGGMPIDKTWSFSTAGLSPIGFCPNNPVAGPNQTFTLQLSGGSGRFTGVRWSQSASAIADLRWLGNTALSIDTGTIGNATITVKDSDNREASTTLTVQAGASVPVCGGASGAPAVTLSKTSLDFGQVALGSTSSIQSVTLSNSGNAALSLTSIDVSGDFLLTHDCGSTLAAGAGCTLSLRFQPTASGSRSGAISIASNASGSPHRVTLVGNGGASAGSNTARFTAAVSGPPSRQSVALTIEPSSVDSGQTREVYVAAIVFGELFFFDGQNWQFWLGGNRPPLWRTLKLSGTLNVPLASNLDVTPLCGIDLAIGYGRSFDEMVTAGRYAVVHRLCQ